MRPGQTHLNEFELAIVQRMADKHPFLLKYLSSLHVISRTYTGVGSFTKFLCESPNKEIPNQQIGLDELINMPGVPNGMSAVLFCEGDKPECLEIAVNGIDPWDGIHEGFTISTSA